MALKPVPVDRFGGLTVSVDPLDVGAAGAIDVLNVDFSDPGVIKQRPGSARWSSAQMPVSRQAVIFPFTTASTAAVVLAVTGATSATTYMTVKAANSSGSVSSVSLAVNPQGAQPVDYAVLGTPTNSYAWITSRKITGQPLTLNGIYNDGSTLGAINVSTSPRWVAVTPRDNRLAIANFADATAGNTTPSGANASTSTVFFSNPGDPTTFGPNNYVYLTPGDGEEIQGMGVWQDYLLVFKRTRMFVFYGNSTDATGQPVFNYRTVTLPPGAAYTTFGNPMSKGAAGPDGFYFFGTDGIYKTTGGPPVKISTVLDDLPIVRSSSLPTTTWFHPSTSIIGGPPITFVGKLMFTATGLVLNTQTNDWSYWNLGGAPFSFFTGTGSALTLFANPSDDFVYTLDASLTTDNGAAIVSRYRSGFFSPAGEGVEATVRETEMAGSGTVMMTWSRDLQSTLTASSAKQVTMTNGYGLHRASAVGNSLSYQIDANGPFSLNRLVARVREGRSR